MTKRILHLLILLLVATCLLSLPSQASAQYGSCNGSVSGGTFVRTCSPVGCDVLTTPDCTCSTPCVNNTPLQDTCGYSTQAACTAPHFDCQQVRSCTWTPAAPSGGYGCTSAGSCTWVSWTTASYATCMAGCTNPTNPPTPPPTAPPPPKCGEFYCNGDQKCCGDSYCIPNTDTCPTPSKCVLVADMTCRNGGVAGSVTVPGAGITGCSTFMPAVGANGQMTISSINANDPNQLCSAEWSVMPNSTYPGLAIWEYTDESLKYVIGNQSWIGPSGQTILNTAANWALNPTWLGTGGVHIRNNEATVTFPADTSVPHKYLITPACVTADNYLSYHPNPGGDQWRWDLLRDQNCARSASYEPPAPTKTCTVSASSMSVTRGDPITITVTGGANYSTNDTARLFVEQTDFKAFSATPSAASVPPYTAATGERYYQLPAANCTITNGATCTNSITLSDLPTGNYYFHCDVSADPNKCSGNPYCSYEGYTGATGNCGSDGWQSCSLGDNVNVVVDAGLPPTPTGLAAACLGVDTQRLTWDVTPDASEYLVRIDDGNPADRISPNVDTIDAVGYATDTCPGYPYWDVCVSTISPTIDVLIKDPTTFTPVKWFIYGYNAIGQSLVPAEAMLQACAPDCTVISPITMDPSNAISFVPDTGGYVPLSLSWMQSTAGGTGTSFDVTLAPQDVTPPTISKTYQLADLVVSDVLGTSIFTATIDSAMLESLYTQLAAANGGLGTDLVDISVTAKRYADPWCETNNVQAVTIKSDQIDSTERVTIRVRKTSTDTSCTAGSLVDGATEVLGTLKATDSLGTVTEVPNSNADMPVVIPTRTAVTASYTYTNDVFDCNLNPTSCSELSRDYTTAAPAKICQTAATQSDADGNVTLYISQLDLASWWETVGGLVYGKNTVGAALPLDIDGKPELCPLIASPNTYDPRCSPFLVRSPAYTLDLLSGLPFSSDFSGRTGGWLSERLQGTSSNQFATDTDDSLKANAAALKTTSGTAYQYFIDLVSTKTTLSTIALNGLNAGLPPTSGYYNLEIDVSSKHTLDPAATLDVAVDKSLVFFVNGDLRINNTANLSKLITVAPGGFVAFIVKGNIEIDANIGSTVYTGSMPGAGIGVGISPAPDANLAGIYLADGTITILSNGTTPDKRFIGEGSFIGKTGFSLPRKYSYQTSAFSYFLAGYTPTELFRHRPDIVLATPEELKEANTQYQEIQ